MLDWFHIVVTHTKNSDGIILWLNGTALGFSTSYINQTITNTGSALKLGKGLDPRYGSIYLDEIRIKDGFYTPSEVEKIFGKLKQGFVTLFDVNDFEYFCDTKYFVKFRFLKLLNRVFCKYRYF